MIRKSILALAVAAALSPMAAQAVAVGDIQLHSALNEALNADISLLKIDETELEGLRVMLASPEAFARVGIERPYYLTGLQFTPMRNTSGEPIVHVSSKAAIKDPFLNFLVEINWSRGKALREFTLLLDPPTSYKGSAPQINAQQTDFTASIQRPDAPADIDAKKYQVVTNDTLWAIAKRHKYQGVTSKQMLDAIFRNNPDAFIKNDMNRLKAGQVLRIPSVQAMAGTADARARHEYLAKAPSWDATDSTQANVPSQAMPLDARASIPPSTDQGDRVELLTADSKQPQDPGKGSFEERTLGQLEKDLLLARELNEKVNSENTELQGRLKYLESQLTDLQRLLKLKSDNAAQLQEEALLRQRAEEIQAKIEEVKTAAAEEAAKPEIAEPPAMPTEEAAKPEAKPEIAEPPAMPTEEAAKPEAMPEIAQPPAMSTEDIAKPEAMPEIAQPPAMPIEEAAKPEAMPEIAQPLAAPTQESLGPEAVQSPAIPVAEQGPKADIAPATPAAEQDLMAWLLENPAIPAAGAGALVLLLLLALKRRRKGTTEGNEKWVDTGILNRGTQAAIGEDQAVGSAQVIQDTMQDDSGDSSLLVDFTPSELVGMRVGSSIDPVSEANVLMAYGRYQEAQKMLLEGLEQTPERNEIKFKLLEVLYAAGNKSEFLKTAAAYLNQGLARQEPEGWGRIAHLGQELDPDNPIFRLAAQVSGEETRAGESAEILDIQAPEPALDEMDSFRTQGNAPYAAVLSNVAQDIAALDDEVADTRPDTPAKDDYLVELAGLDLDLLPPDSAAEPLADRSAIDSGDLDLSDLDLSRLDADSQVWPDEEPVSAKPKDFAHEDILGQDSGPELIEPVIDFSSDEDQELLSRLEADIDLQGGEIDSELTAILDKAGPAKGDAARMDLASELSSLTQELENFAADSELHLHPMDDDSLLTKVPPASATEEDVTNTLFLEGLAEGKFDLDDYDLGKDSINLEEELASLEGMGVGGSKATETKAAETKPDIMPAADLDLSSFDLNKELVGLGDFGLDFLDEKSEKDAKSGPLDDLDFSSIDLEQELAGLDFLNDTDAHAGDQVQTKLELAEAYIEMGDAEGAREILAEVKQDGTLEQQAKAKAMLASIG